jgi:hypothetical protein
MGRALILMVLVCGIAASSPGQRDVEDGVKAMESAGYYMQRAASSNRVPMTLQVTCTRTGCVGRYW